VHTAAEGKLLRIFISQNDRLEGATLYERIVDEAKRLEMSGATVLRGMMGFGAGSRIHTTKWVRLTDDMPVVIEIVDTGEKIEKLMPFLDRVLGDGFVTIEKIRYRKYRRDSPDA
jgi:uncharacterized protein